MSSSRFPGKPLAKINGRELVLRVADIAKKAKYFDRIIIATEDEEIRDLAIYHHYESWITKSHYTCTHRVAEVASQLSCDYVFNLQGDEPMTNPDDLDKVVEFGVNNNADMVQPYRALTDQDLEDEDCVQMIVNNDRVMHMERVPPTVTNNLVTQIGMYFYKRQVIQDFPNLDMTWVKHWKGLDTIGFCGRYEVVPFELDERTQAIDRPEHIQIVEQQL
tara:strand:- start:98 stop:754 length:657 start_codon:yes stop_codon:yes gene_type:complete